MFKTQCGELGHITQVVVQKPRHKSPHNQAFRCDDLSSPALEQMRNMARTVSGIEDIVPTERGGTGFVLVMGNTVSAKGAQQTAVDFVNRVVRYFNRRDANEQRLLSGEVMAVHSHTEAPSGSAG